MRFIIALSRVAIQSGTGQILGGHGGAFGREGKCTGGFPICLIVHPRGRQGSPPATAFGVGGRTKCTRQWNAGMRMLALRRRAGQACMRERNQVSILQGVGFPASASIEFAITYLDYTAIRVAFSFPTPFRIASLRCPKLSSSALHPSSGIKVMMQSLSPLPKNRPY